MYNSSGDQDVDLTHASMKDGAERSKKLRDDHLQLVFKINTHIVYIAAGSISVLLTFVGILYNSNRDADGLKPDIVIWASSLMLASMFLLLLTRYLQSLVAYKKNEVYDKMVVSLYLVKQVKLGLPGEVLKKPVEALVQEGMDYAEKSNAWSKKEGLYSKIIIGVGALGCASLLAGFVLSIWFLSTVANSISATEPTLM